MLWLLTKKPRGNGNCMDNYVETPKGPVCRISWHLVVSLQIARRRIPLTLPSSYNHVGEPANGRSNYKKHKRSCLKPVCMLSALGYCRNMAFFHTRAGLAWLSTSAQQGRDLHFHYNRATCLLVWVKLMMYCTDWWDTHVETFLRRTDRQRERKLFVWPSFAF